jgi:hypothetical protein
MYKIMGASWSTTKIRNELVQHFNNEQVTQIMKDVNTFVHAVNNIRFHNTGYIKNVKIFQSIDFRQAVIGDIVLKSMENFGMDAELRSKFDNIVSTEGLFTMSKSNIDVQNTLSQVVNNTEILDVKETIRNSFNLKNSFVVENDQLSPTTFVENVDITQIQQEYNTLLNNYFMDKIQTVDMGATNDSDIKNKTTGSGLLNNTQVLYLMIGAVAIGGIFVVVRFGKK